MSASVLGIITIIQLALQYAPEAAKVYREARDLFFTLFKEGKITVEEQNALNQWADAHEAATLAGQVPPELQVEPDPI